ncbi:secondary thiamine-phosphate synthase enzyme YjbQ [Alkalibacterium olivapovliticus]|uniref:Secondary thiamine-phosphate synthase enzyme n=1 Tax=Alkalibacterium olivapovliticus TaxID=99907 RepID=A0A2T0W772_9LACT|nr:secondary thiamine-phosphate synthase enzyme YjbQ [Alkalibacterium olivapovliticus]PRY82555.1 secondary thiamine-phosphate synthase enzyme [Alkalibacterium olivapovliticus]
MSYIKQFEIKTHEKQAFLMLDAYLEEALKESKVEEGIMVVFCPHTTAGITINENADPDVKTDLKKALNDTFPNHDYFIHMEGNSDGHMKSSLVGASETVLIHKGELLFGTWQSVYFTEFDGPRSRQFFVKIIEG